MRLSFKLIFYLLLTTISAIAQNTCNAPQTITNLPFSPITRYTTCGKGREYSNFMACRNGHMFNQDYVFEFTPTDENNCINISGSFFYETPGLFIVDGCPDEDSAVCVRQAVEGNGNPHVLSINDAELTPGRTYFIIVAGRNQCGQFTISVTESNNCQPEPEGASCNSAKIINALPFESQLENTCGKQSFYNQGNSCGNTVLDGEEMVFAYTPTESECVTFELSTALNGFGMFLYQGCPTDANSRCLKADRNFTGGDIVFDRINLEANKTHYLMVARSPGSNPPCGPFNLSISSSVVGDGATCENSLHIGTIPQANQSFSTACMLSDYLGFSGCNTSVFGDDLVIEFDVDVAQCYEFQFTNISRNGRFLLMTGCPTDTNAQCIESTRCNTTLGCDNLTMIASLSADTSYYIIAAAGSLREVLDFDLAITDETDCVESSCANPTVISSTPYESGAESTHYRINNYSNGGCQSSYMAGEDITYEYTPQQDECIEILLTNVTNKCGLFVYDNCPDAVPSACLGGAVNDANVGNDTLLYRLDVEFGKTYYITVSSDDPFESVEYELFLNSNSASDNCSFCAINTCETCADLGVEDATFDRWDGAYGFFFTPYETPELDQGLFPILNEPRTRHTIVHKGYKDPILNDRGIELHGVNPRFGGQYGMRLGNSESLRKAEALRANMLVDSGNSILVYSYAVILQDPGHISREQPYFRINVKDESQQNIVCADFEVSAGANIPGFESYLGGIYKRWTDVAVPLVDYIGEEVEINFITADCDQGGHYGYAYLDVRCEPFAIQLSTGNDVLCEGDTAVLRAPAGLFKYRWNTGDTTQSITVTTGGNYVVDMETVTGCILDLEFTVNIDQHPVADYAIIGNCQKTTIDFVSQSTTTGTPINTYLWDFGDGSFDTTSTAQTTHIFERKGTYNTQLNIITDNLCIHDTAFSFTVDSTYIPEISNNGPYCLTNDTITLTTSFAGGQWSGDGITNTNTGKFYPADAGIGIHPISYQLDSACTQTALDTIEVKDILDATILGPDSTCRNADALNILSVDASGFWFGKGIADTTSDIYQPQLVASPLDTIIHRIDGQCPDADTFVIALQDIELLSTNTTGVTCHDATDGSVEIIANNAIEFSVDGGAWQTSNQFNGLSAGTHTAQVRSSLGCLDAQNFEISSPQPLSALFIDVQESICNEDNGSISIEIHGGTAPFTTNWSNGADATVLTDLTPNFYQATITDRNNCTTQIDTNITAVGFFDITFVATEPTCNGFKDGRVEAITSNNLPPYTYEWHNGTNNASTLDAAGVFGVRVTDGQGCVIEKDTVIDEPDAILLELVEKRDACFDTENGVITLSAEGGVGNISFNWLPNDTITTSFANSLPADDYRIIALDSFNCADTVEVTINEIDSILIDLDESPVSCFDGNDGSLALSNTNAATPIQLIWSNGSNTASINNLDAGNYSLTVVDANGCNNNVSTVLENPTPVEIQVDTQHLSCFEANDGSINITTTGGTGNYNYAWQPNTYNGATINNLPAGNYNCVISDDNNCSVSTNIDIESPRAIHWISTVEHPACFNGNTGKIELQHPFILGNPVYTWQHDATITTNTADSLVAGNYTITVTDSTNCSADTSIIINNAQEITGAMNTIDASKNNACDGVASVTLNAHDVNDFIFAWSTTDTGQGLFELKDLCAGTYDVTLTNVDDCRQSFSAIVNEPDALSINLTSSPTACVEVSSGKAFATVVGGTPPYQYFWQSVPVQTTDSAQNLPAGNITLIVIDAANDTGFATTNVGVSPPFSVDVTSMDVNCFNAADGQITATSTNGFSPFQYAWSHNAALNNPTVNNLVPNTYAVTVTDQFGCTATESNIVINEPPVLNITTAVTDVSCFGENSGTVTTNTTGGTLPYSFAWNNGSSNPDLSSVVAGNYTVVVTDDNNCTATSTGVVQEPNELTSSITATDLTCHQSNDGSVNFSFIGGVAPYTVSWQDDSNNDDTQRFSLKADSYAATVTDGNNCTSTASITVNQPLPVVIDAAVVQNTCSGLENGFIDLSGKISGGTTPYQITWSNGVVNQFKIDQLQAGRYQVEVKDQHNCGADDRYFIDILETPTLDIEPQYQLQEASELFIELAQTDYTYSWQPDTFVTAFNAYTFVLRPQQTTQYTIEFTDENGCSGTAGTKVILIPNEFYAAPSAFTPNNDGVNDVFGLKLHEQIEVLTFQVFNRWGELVHNNNQSWTGHYKGKLQPIDVYSWQAELLNTETKKRFKVNGNVSLMR